MSVPADECAGDVDISTEMLDSLIEEHFGIPPPATMRVFADIEGKARHVVTIQSLYQIAFKLEEGADEEQAKRIVEVKRLRRQN